MPTVRSGSYNRRAAPAALGGLLLAALLHPFASAAQTGSLPTPPPHQYLFLLETSHAMQRRTPGLEQTVQAMFNSNFGGKMRPGDRVGIWSFNQGVTRAMPFERWSPQTTATLGQHLTNFIHAQKFEGQADFQSVLPELQRVAREAEVTSVIVLSSGEHRLAGTPFDGPINQSWQQWQGEQQKGRMPIVTLLVAVDGRLAWWSVTPAPWPVEFPAGSVLAAASKALPQTPIQVTRTSPPASNSPPRKVASKAPEFAPLPSQPTTNVVSLSSKDSARTNQSTQVTTAPVVKPAPGSAAAPSAGVVASGKNANPKPEFAPLPAKPTTNLPPALVERPITSTNVVRSTPAPSSPLIATQVLSQANLERLRLKAKNSAAPAPRATISSTETPLVSEKSNSTVRVAADAPAVKLTTVPRNETLTNAVSATGQKNASTPLAKTDALMLADASAAKETNSASSEKVNATPAVEKGSTPSAPAGTSAVVAGSSPVAPRRTDAPASQPAEQFLATHPVEPAQQVEHLAAPPSTASTSPPPEARPEPPRPENLAVKPESSPASEPLAPTTSKPILLAASKPIPLPKPTAPPEPVPPPVPEPTQTVAAAATNPASAQPVHLANAGSNTVLARRGNFWHDNAMWLALLFLTGGASVFCFFMYFRSRVRVAVPTPVVPLKLAGAPISHPRPKAAPAGPPSAPGTPPPPPTAPVPKQTTPLH